MLDKNAVANIADKAKLIVSGYAFSPREDGFISILNLNHPDCAMVINKDCDIIETNMDPIEQHIVLEISRKNLQFLEVENAMLTLITIRGASTRPRKFRNSISKRRCSTGTALRHFGNRKRMIRTENAA